MMLMLALLAPAYAVPTLQHQARVLDASGSPLEGSETVMIELLGPSGEALYSETFERVRFQDGYFTVQLGGEGTPLTSDMFRSDVFISTTVGDVTLPIQTPLSAVPTAMHAWGVQLGPVSTCVVEGAGTLRWTGSTVEVCDGSDWIEFSGGADDAPLPITFVDVEDASPGSVVTSASVTVTGFEVPLTATCTGCSVEHNGSGDFRPSVDRVLAGDSLRIRTVASTQQLTTVTSTVTLGNTVSSPWSVTSSACEPGVQIFDSPGTFSLPPGCTHFTAKVWGEGGATAYPNTFPDGPAGGGGYTQATIQSVAGMQWRVDVNEGGGGGFNPGGGFSAVFLGEEPWVMAGGGGGGAANTTYAGGAGGGEVGEDGAASGTPYRGGSPSAGCGRWNESAGSSWAGGGQGWYNGCTGGSDGAGGGGSGYAHPLATDVVYETGSGSTPGNVDDPDRGSAGIGGARGNARSNNGRVVIHW